MHPKNSVTRGSPCNRIYRVIYGFACGKPYKVKVYNAWIILIREVFFRETILSIFPSVSSEHFSGKVSSTTILIHLRKTLPLTSPAQDINSLISVAEKPITFNTFQPKEWLNWISNRSANCISTEKKSNKILLIGLS